MFGPKLQRKISSLGRFLAILAISLFLFSVVLNFLADNFYTKRVIQSIVNEKLYELTDLRVSYNALEFRALPFRIDLFGLELTRTDGLSIQATRLKIGLNVIHLLLGKSNLVELVLYGLKLDLAQFQVENSKDSGPFIFPESFESFGIAMVGLRNSEISFRDEEKELLVRDFNLELAFRSEERIQLKLDAHRVYFQYEDFSIFQVADIHVEMSMQDSAQSRLSILVLDGPLDFSANSDLSILLNPDRSVQDYKFKGKFSGKGDLSVLGRILNIEDSKGDTIYSGDFSFPTQKMSEPFDLLIQSKVDVQDGYIGGFRVFDSEGQLRVTRKLLSFDRVSLIRNGTELAKTQGSIELKKGGSFAFMLEPLRLDLDSTFKALKVETDVFESVMIGGSLDLNGVMKPFQMTARGSTQLEDLRLTALSLPPDNALNCTADLDLSIDSQKMAVDNTKLNCEGKKSKAVAPCQLSGNIFFEESKGLNLKNECLNADFSIFEDVLNLPFQGAGSLQQNIVGPYSKVWLKHNIQAQSLVFGKVDLGRVQVNLDLDYDMNLHWNQFVAYLPHSVGVIKSSKGRSTLDFEVDFDLDASKIPMGFISQVNETFLPDSPFVFAVSEARGQIKGPLIFPLYQKTQARFQVEDVSYMGRYLAQSVSGQLESEDRLFRLRSGVYQFRDLTVDFTVQASHSSFQASLPQLKENIYGLAGQDRLDIEFETRSNLSKDGRFVFQDHVQQLPIVGGFFEGMKLESHLTGIGQLSGLYRDLRLRADLTFHNLRWYQREISPLSVQVSQNSSLLAVRARQKDGALDTNLEFRGQELRASGHLKRFSLLPLMYRVIGEDPRHFSYLSSGFQLSMDLNQPIQTLSGQIDFSEMETGWVDDQKTHVLVLEKGRSLKFDRSKVSLVQGENLRWVGEGYSVTLTPQGAQSLERLNIHLRGDIDLAAVSAMVEVVESGSGFLDFEGEIKGSVERLDPVLRFRSRSEVSLGLSRPGLANIRTHGRYENGELIVEEFRADKGNGTIRMRGVVGLDGVKPSALEIALEKAFFVVRTDVLKNIDTELSGQLNLTGEKWPFRLSGDVQVDRAISTRNVDFRDQIVSALQMRGQTRVGSSESLDASSNLVLDINLTANRSLEIYNRNVRAVMSADLNITGTDLQPQVSGQLQIVQGSFSYKYRRDFNITQGLITFDNPVILDPKVDIVGVSEIGNYRVFIALTGRSSDVRVDLSADPPSRDDGSPLTKVDLLVLMSQGSLPDRSRSEIATQDAAKAEALNIIVGQFEEPVEKIFDMTNQNVLRQVYFDSYSGSDGQPKARVNLPLNLHTDWDVIFRVDSENLRMSLGYDINPSISVSGNIDRKTNSTTSESAEESNDTGVDLRFRFMFP